MYILLLKCDPTMYITLPHIWDTICRISTNAIYDKLFQPTGYLPAMMVTGSHEF